ncbi:hypothetical protein EDD86DRAFT_212742 [Gorgonomyces haynaldii]|nr:hypothetical protein EDD86DRAFT_212742 [Gorgonomyces haynaldii]
MESLVEQATSETNTGENWSLLIQICERADSSEQSAREAVTLVSKRLQHRNVNVLLFSLTLSNALVQNCGSKVRREISSRLFVDSLLQLLRRANVHVVVKNRILELIQTWAQDFKSDSSLSFIVDTFESLRREYQFPAEKPKSPQKKSMSDKEREEEELQLALALSLSEKDNRPAQREQRQESRERRVLFAVKALYDFHPTEEGELRLAKGDIVDVYDCTTFPDWWQGSIHGRNGIFPANYVQKLQKATGQDPDQQLLSQLPMITRVKQQIHNADPLGHNVSENEKLARDYQEILELRPKVIAQAEKTRKKQDDLTLLNHQFTQACHTYQRLMEMQQQQYQQQVYPQYPQY